jgi:hypothetical protein
MLAYLDDVLDPQDAKDIGHKIEESEFASSLVHRTRDVMRRLRLGAPKLHGKGAGVDANSVAEYLDNTLSPERVADFERICLESDVHLAEVACCHQILAIVLGEPADVDPESRKKMYSIPAKYEELVKKLAEHAAETDGEEHAGEGHPATPAKHRPRREVPDYLRTPAETTGARRFATVIFLALLLLAVLVMAVNPSMLQRWFNPDAGPAVARNNGSGTTTVAGTWPSKAASSGATGTSQDAAKGQVGSSTATPPAGSGAAVGPSESDQGEGPLPVEPPVDVKTPSKSDTPESSPASEPAADQKTAPQGTAEPGKSGGAATVEPPPPAGNIPAAQPINALGNLTSRNTFMFRHDGGGGEWQLLEPLSNVAAGWTLVSPYAIENRITFESGLTLQLLGDSRVRVLPPSHEGGPPGIELHYGRAILIAVAAANTQVRVVVAGRQAEITFVTSGSTAALETRFVREPGSNPEVVASSVLVDLYAVAGQIEWVEGAGQPPLSLRAPVGRTVGAELVERPLPEWTRTESLPLIMTKAVPVLAAELMARPRAGDPPGGLEQQLVELGERFKNRNEVMALALRCLASIDKPEWTIAALNEDRGATYWPMHIENLKAIIARSPQSAALVRQAFEKVRGDKSEALFRMLWGYSAKDLSEGEEAKRLVDYLEHPELDFRVLASWNLRDITGIKYINYRPEDHVQRRQNAAQQWRGKLEAGQIVPKRTASRGAAEVPLR